MTQINSSSAHRLTIPCCKIQENEKAFTKKPNIKQAIYHTQ